MSAAEAKAMDPQLRILLETTYHAFESGMLNSPWYGNYVQVLTSLYQRISPLTTLPGAIHQSTLGAFRKNTIHYLPLMRR